MVYFTCVAMWFVSTLVRTLARIFFKSVRVPLVIVLLSLLVPLLLLSLVLCVCACLWGDLVDLNPLLL
jgi:hypothetical protein